MSHRALGPQFFHGTTATLRPGDVVGSKSALGLRVESHSANDPEYAYATDDHLEAMRYARQKSPGGIKEWHVYTVEPVEDHEPDPNYAGAEGPRSWRSRSGYRVTGDVSQSTWKEFDALPTRDWDFNA